MRCMHISKARVASKLVMSLRINGNGHEPFPIRKIRLSRYYHSRFSSHSLLDIRCSAKRHQPFAYRPHLPVLPQSPDPVRSMEEHP